MRAGSATPVLSFQNASKVYRQASGAELHALREVTCRIEPQRAAKLESGKVDYVNFRRTFALVLWPKWSSVKWWLPLRESDP